MRELFRRVVAASRDTHPSGATLTALALSGCDDAAEWQAGVRTHVAGCPSCAARLARLEWAAGRARGAAETEADEAFDLRRLARQRNRVLRRIQPGGRRVVSFPSRLAPRRADRLVARRWVAAAAALGLVVGALTGRWLGLRPLQPRWAAQTSVASADAKGDEAFLLELEDARDMPRIAALAALEGLTPDDDPLQPRR